MTTHRFDAFAKSFATRFSRRTALQATGLGLAAGLASSRVTAHEATPTPTSDRKTFFLFVQTFLSGSFTPNAGAGTPPADGTPVPGGGADYLLTLQGHPGGTIYFSDRPDRIFGEAPTQAFLDGLGFTPANPPNAALVAQTDDGSDEVVVLELFDPTYDEAASTLTYGATILGEYAGEGLAHVAAQQQDAMLPEIFGRSSLFIDDCKDATDCNVTKMVLDGFVARPAIVRVGPIPSGTHGKCWYFGDFICHPCNKNYTNESLSAQCNAAYPACEGRCQAY